ncbi:interferon-induced very large GTPase 1-like isoform X2 [Apostichopus japonicus]|uniref:interferon-induced very large GTPase 1-like isoform X2 n=1 Tax=Stichopus japonicus TaxID=307972 RepID=UPI003AB40516
MEERLKVTPIKTDRSISTCSSTSFTMSDPGSPGSYSQMLLDLQQSLTITNIRQLAMAAGLDAADRSEFEGINDSMTCFSKLRNKLENRDQLGEKNLVFLKDTLKKIEHERGLGIIKTYEEADHIPSSPESSDDESDTARPPSHGFVDYLKLVGLEGRLGKNLTLRDVTVVRETSIDGPVTDLPFIFLKKLTSLDYMALLPETYNERIKSIRDFVYAILKCSDDFLTQYIFEKLSVCQIAVPIILPAVAKTDNPTFKLWAVRRVIKEWKTGDSVFLEKRISSWPTFIVAFVRVGDLPLSKSILINNMLSRGQGNRNHSYFLSKKDDYNENAHFSKGTVESLWYIPSVEQQSQSVDKVITVLNMRGNSDVFPRQTKLVCKMANLVIAIIAKESKKEMKQSISKLRAMSQKVIYVSLKRSDDLIPKKIQEPVLKDGWLFYKVKESDEGIPLSKTLWGMIEKDFGNATKKLPVLEEFAGNPQDDVIIDENIEKCRDTKLSVEKLFETDCKIDLAAFKEKYLPLQKLFLDWVKCDKRRLKSEHCAENRLAEIRKEKKEKRGQQKAQGLSEKLKTFLENLEGILTDREKFHYFLFYFQEHVDEMVVESITPHLNEMTRLEKELRQREDEINSAKKSKKRKQSSQKKTAVDEITRLKDRLYSESHSYSSKYIGYEHFLREVGQLFESFVNGSDLTHEPRIAKLPQIAANMLLEGYPLELLDGDSGYVPIKWVTHVLEILSKELDNPKLFVLSVIGIQSSGKSTLLNAMFGVRFPVRAGRCTRGLFMQLLPVEESYSSKLGFKFLVVIDTEGLRSPDRALLNKYDFDNALATLALCLADLNIVNIQGEVISQDMIGILQIAVHALIRMKRVNLKSHCQIVQQRISDTTACDRNKANMNKILEVLDKATITAASEEDVADQYKKFSDVFPFTPDNDITYVPCLWTGHMSPPNHCYSETVTELANLIFGTFSSQTTRIKPQLTVDGFIGRLKDVWKAIKEEDFVFNFQNSSRALSYDKFRLQFHKWMGQLRQNSLEWELREVGTQVEIDERSVSKLKSELGCELTVYSNNVKTEIDKYIKGHPNEDELIIHESAFKHEVDAIASEIKSGILGKLENVEKEQLNVTQVIEERKVKLREMARKKAQELRQGKASRKEKLMSEKGIRQSFEECWNDWTKQIEEHDVKLKRSSEIQKDCQASLMQLSDKTAVNKRIRELIEEEGDINHHQKCFNVKDYIEPHTSELEIKRIEPVVKKVIKGCLKTCRRKMFDKNLVNFWLGNAINQLLAADERYPKIPKSVVSKCLLHISGNIADILIKNQIVLTKLVEKERENLFKDFRAFIDVSRQCENTASRVFDCCFHIFKEITIQRLNIKIVKDMREQDKFIDKERLIAAVLEDLAERDNYLQYINFVENQESFIKRWVKQKVIDRCYDEPGARLLDIANETITELCSTVRNICIDLDISGKKSGPFCEWLDQFQEKFDAACRYNATALNGLKSFGVTIDYKEFSKCLMKLIESKQETFIKAVCLPFTEGGEDSANEFLDKMAKAPHLEIVNQFISCEAKCPFCKVMCHLQEKDHKHHSAILHYPQGIAGCKFTESKNLVLDMCTTSVASENQYRFGEQEEHRPFKEYKNDFPNWSIQPIKDSEPTQYWKWVMVRFNTEFAEHYNLEPAKIPDDWTKIGKKKALQSLKRTYMTP